MSFVPAKKGSQITDNAANAAKVALPGELYVGNRIDDVSVNFQYGISSVDIMGGGVSSGTGVVAPEKSMATVSCGTGVGTAEIESREAIRYRAGHECYAAVSAVLGAPEAGVNQYAGLYDGVDAWCFGYQGLDFGLWFIEGGNVNFINQVDFNVDKLDGAGESGYDINPQGGQLYYTTYTWHGFLPLVAEVYTDTGEWVVVHKINTLNTATETHLENPNLPVTLKIERLSGSGSDITIKSGSWRAGVNSGMEENNAADRWFGDFVLDSVKSNDATHADHIITLRSKDIFQGKINHIKTDVKIIVTTNTTNKDLAFLATKLSALDPADQATINAGFADLNADDSVMESSKVSLLFTDVLTGSQIGDVAVIQAGGQRANTDVQGFDIHPGEDVVFGVLGAANGTYSFQLNVKELH